MSSVDEDATRNPSNSALESLATDGPDPGAAPGRPVESPAERRKRSLAIAWGAAIFLALGLGLPIWYALGDWRAGLITAVVVGGLTVVGYLKAGSAVAEQRADRLADRYAREDQDDEDDDGSYN